MEISFQKARVTAEADRAEGTAADVAEADGPVAGEWGGVTFIFTLMGEVFVTLLLEFP